MSAREPIILFRVLGGAAAAFRSIARRRRAQGDQGAQLLGASPPGVAIGRGARRAGARCSACSREHGEGGGGADGAVDLVDGGSMEVYVQRAVEQWMRRSRPGGCACGLCAGRCLRPPYVTGRRRAGTCAV